MTKLNITGVKPGFHESGTDRRHGHENSAGYGTLT